MDGLEEKTIKTSRGLTYRYYISSAVTESCSKPALMLHHGFPDTAHLWSRMLPYLARLTNRLLIPDLLGFGGTSKPSDPKLYAYNLMTKDLLDILDAEGIEKVVSMGHDHGSGSAARFYNHARDRTAGLILLNVAYQPPNSVRTFDLDAVNAVATKAFGYPVLEYWNFFTAPDAPRILEQNMDRYWDCAHAATFVNKKNLYCTVGAMRAYLTNHSVHRIEVKSYARDQKTKEAWVSRMQEGGFAAPLCWYISRVEGVQDESDKAIREENIKVNVPVLFIGCDEDAVCRKEMINGSQNAGLLPRLTVETLEGVGHWPMYECPERTADLVTNFINEQGL